jgi:hypothetical protein
VVNIEGEETYWQNNAIQNIFAEKNVVFNDTVIDRSMFDIRSSGDFWVWARGPFMNSVLRDTYADRPGYFNRYLRILGVVQFRQLRVRNNSCSVPTALTSYVSSCYADFSTDAEDVKSYGPPPPGSWKWYTAHNLNSQSFTGSTGIVYSGSGFNVSMPLQSAAASVLLEGMQRHSWIDLQTSVIFIDFVVVNPNVKLFSLVKLIFEFPPSSPVKPSVYVQTARFDLIIPSEGGVSASETWLMLQVSLFLLLEIVKLGTLRADYFRDPWVILDWWLYCSYIAAFALRLQPYSFVSQVGWPPKPTEFVNYQGAFVALGQFRNVIALCSVLTWIKNFKYLQLVPFLSYLMGAISNAVGQALAYAVIFVNCIWAFTIAHVLVFGSDIGDFSTVGRAMFTLYRVLLGDDKFEGMWAFDQVLGPLFYFGWSIVGTFFLAVSLPPAPLLVLYNIGCNVRLI